MKREFGARLRGSHDRVARPVPEEPPAVRALLQRRAELLARRRGVVELPDGSVVENERGSCFLRRLCYPLDTRHGTLCLGDALRCDRDRLAALTDDASVAELDLAACTFLDTETTGLSGGAGTVVFMVGLAHFDLDRGELVVEQVFLRSFGDEPALLQHVSAALRARPHLVTFVGKTFDRHRLAARMSVQRVRSRVLSSRHLDLYYLARRAWRTELPNVRLQTVERHRLGVQRCDDLPGSAAPVAFFDWLRDGTGPVDLVFEHNRLDVLSLVVLLARLGRG
ncbi:MAG: ribonuclease H-like domain-containing protein [Planctomycetes bacterium]|nr:ribonuclease H-like domain-containing protein [Planctomycetota bacterium]MCB9868663.1 ribonuclease H-like domain-containing protein [Planctomycetota bacterium]